MPLIGRKTKMDRKALLSEMKNSVGTQDPVVFFAKMIDVFNLLFDRIDELEFEVKGSSLKATLAIQWEPKVASGLLSSAIDEMRGRDKELYCEEISQLKKAFVEDKITQNYQDFCKFWEEVLGYHPFLDYNK